MKDGAIAQLSDQVMALTARMQNLKESNNNIRCDRHDFGVAPGIVKY